MKHKAPRGTPDLEKAGAANFSKPEADLETMAGWVAPIATMIAAMMTAANLGARMTGWGFVIFTIGSICWSIIGWTGDETGLLTTNLFLTLVNAVGIWRWLGRQRAYEDGGQSAARSSARSSAPTLFTATGIAGKAVEDLDAHEIGKAVEALIECETGRVSYVVVASGGVGGIDESLRAVPHDWVGFCGDRMRLTVGKTCFLQLPELPDGDWPVQAEQGA